MNLNLQRVAIDTLIIYALTFLAGFVLGLIAGVMGTEVNAGTLSIAVLVLTCAGFAYSSYRAEGNRLMHLSAVGAGLWLVSGTNVLFGFAGVSEWMYSILIILVCGTIGGGIGVLLAKAK